MSEIRDLQAGNESFAVDVDFLERQLGILFRAGDGKDLSDKDTRDLVGLEELLARILEAWEFDSQDEEMCEPEEKEKCREIDEVFAIPNYVKCIHLTNEGNVIIKSDTQQTHVIAPEKITYAPDALLELEPD